jgi:hypothetical protein
MGLVFFKASTTQYSRTQKNACMHTFIHSFIHSFMYLAGFKPIAPQFRWSKNILTLDWAATGPNQLHTYVTYYDINNARFTGLEVCAVEK